MLLNEKQKKVVYTNKHFLFLLAGAGSGKTRVVIERIKYLLSTNVKEDEILALTFTKKAAIEMKHRIQNQDLDIHTFHGFALKCLKDKYNNDFNIVSPDDLKFNKKDLLDIAVYKNSLYKTKKPKLYDLYQNELKKLKAKDFDDILIDFYESLKDRPIYYKYIFIDEFQDTNELQYLILKRLMHFGVYVLAVGDPDQSIYQFRGANVEIINRYIRDYEADVEILDLNYRSSPHIIKIANRFIEQNLRTLKKSLVPYHQEDYEVNKHVFNDLEEEATYIINQYKLFVSNGILPKHIAVLFRNHHRSYVLKQQLKQSYIDEHEGMQLLTMHQAKGLEFDVVFILGLEQGEIPSPHTSKYMTLEEERRLMYVAITRAKKYLYLTYCKHSQTYKRKSKFYKEVKI
jgi:DNA helicase-2/ATP-dependent DNA helicase PcrA